MDGAADAVLLLKVDLRDLELGEDDLGLDVPLGGWVDDIFNRKALDGLVLGCIKSVGTHVPTAMGAGDGLDAASVS